MNRLRFCHALSLDANFLKPLALRPDEETAATAIGFPQFTDGPLFFRVVVAPEMLAFVFHCKESQIARRVLQLAADNLRTSASHLAYQYMKIVPRMPIPARMVPMIVPEIFERPMRGR